MIKNKQLQPPQGLHGSRRRGLRLLLVALLTVVSFGAYADRWDGGYWANWMEKEGCFDVVLRFYDSTGRDDVLQDGELYLNDEKILDVDGVTHHDYPYKVTLNPHTCGGKYRFEVWNDNSLEKLDSKRSGVHYSWREESGSGYYYYISLRIYPRYFNETKGKTYNFKLTGEIDRNESPDDKDVTHKFSCRPNTNYDVKLDWNFSWKNDKQLELNWSGDTDYADEIHMKVTLDGKSQTFSGNIPNPIVINNYWGDRINRLMNESFEVKVTEIDIEPEWSSYYSYRADDVTLQTCTFGQPGTLYYEFLPEDSKGNPNRVELTWNMTEKPNNPVKDAFKIQRYRKDEQSGEYKHEKDISVDYKDTESAYTYTDGDGLASGGLIDYRYTLSRNSQKKGYPEQTREFQVSTMHCSPDSIWAETNEAGDAVIVRWKDSDIIWSQGTKCTLTQTDLENMQTYEIKLEESDYRRMEYTATQVKNCGSYEYRIDVTPGKSDLYPEASSAVTKEPVSPYKPGTIENLSISKGYFTDRTEISWDSHSAFDNFIIERKPYEAADSEFKSIGSVSYENALSAYSYDDRKGAVGTIYEYRVYGVVKCVDVKMYSVDTLRAVGFRSSTGVISGRVTYENGQAVQDVEILPQSENQDLGKVVRFDGTGHVVSDKQLTLPAAGFTLEAYLRPDGDNAGKTVMAVGSETLLSFDEDGHLTFSLGGSKVADKVGRDDDTYYHVSAVYDGSVMQLYVDSVPVGTAEASGVTVPAGRLVIGASARLSDVYDNGYTGYMDEVRVWNKALTKDDIKNDYTRLLYGGEKGLMVYYRFNEGVDGEVYDMSFEGETYHEMHATAENVSYTADPTQLPTMEQLFIKGITDENGNYTINGVPYTDNGTQYRIIPRYGTHQFDPEEKVVTMNGTMNNFTADFVDKSSFSVQGHVYYSESTIPVPEVMFEIDGVTAMVDNQVVQTGSDGSFRINVPVGVHKVRAVKSNHTFRNDGYLLDAKGEHRFYGEPIEGVEFRDETRVRLVGRVAGGPVQQAFPLGHSLSKNNLGEELSVKFTLAGSAANMYSIYDDELLPTDPGKVTSKEVNVEHFRPSYWDDDRATESTQVTYGKNAIDIVPSAKTGEFFVDLIPTSYTVTEAKATGHGNFLDANPLQLNVTDSLLGSSIAYEYIIPEEDRRPGMDTLVHDTLYLSARTQFIKRVAPTLEVTQLSKAGTPMDYWGDSICLQTDMLGKADTISIFDRSQTGDDRYMFGKPIMSQGTTYELQAKVFESYPYYGKKDQSNPEQTDRVPVTDGVVNFANDLKGSTDTVHVNGEGVASYKFLCGAPSLSASDGAKKLEVTVQIDDRTIDNKLNMSIIVLGSVTGNNNFVTAGPDLITAVLRDPPGSGSYSYLEAGTSYEYSSTYAGSMDLSQEAGATVSTKASFKTVLGFLGAGTITEIEAGSENAFTAVFEENVTGTEGTVSRLTFTNRWQTSDDPAYVGADADVYIGRSTNVIFGAADALEIVRDGEFDPDFVDKVVDAKNGYSLIQRQALNMGVSLKTMFAYPQIHIESVLIPQLKQVMAQQFNSQVKNDDEAQALADQTQKIVYTTDITDMEDPKFGRDGYYKVFLPRNEGDTEPGSVFSSKNENANLDTILTIRQSIDNWEKAISDNEQKKINAAKKDGENISFQAGVNIERSMEYSGADVNVTSFSIKTGAHQVIDAGSFINAAGVGTTLDFMETMTHGGEYSTTQEATKTFGFVLAEDGTDYISVDVRKVNNEAKLDTIIADAGGDFGKDWSDLLDNEKLKGVQDEYVFITRGGATSCPWEAGSVSKYYKPGTVIDQPTAQMEKPVLTVKESTVTNVPSSRRAVFELHLANESETGDDQYFMLSLIDESNPNGAKFYIDGGALGDGRTFLVPAGGELVKTLEVEKGTEMVYRDLQLSLHSLCQYDPTGFQDLIESTASINVEFVPSSTDLTLGTPLNQWVLNTKSAKDEKGQYYLPITINDFDVNYEYFHHIDVAMKPSSSSDDKWVTKARYYKNEVDMNAQDVDNYSGEKYLIEGPEISYKLVFDSIQDVDQRYDVRAVSASLVQNEFVTTATPVASGVKDTYRPRLFGQPQPADGILGVEDEVQLNFNETIAAGYITANNVRATGVRNGSQNTYSASVNFDGVSEYAETELQKNFENKTFTVEMNLQHSKNFNDVKPQYRDEVLFAMGNMEIGFTATKQLRVKVGESEVLSDELNDETIGQWEHLAVIYERGAQPVVTAYHNQKQVIGATVVEAYAGITNYVIGASLNKDRHYWGKLNEFRIWSEAMTLPLLNKNRGIILSGAEAGLQTYYPMSAGKGNILEDKAGGNHAVLHASWSVNNPGLAAYFLGKSYVQYNMGELGLTEDMDYTLEFWFKADPSRNANAAMVASGQADENDNDGPAGEIYVGFKDGKLVTRNNGYEYMLDGDYCDNDWHHYALTVSRSMDKASIYLDGTLQGWFTGSYFTNITAKNGLTVGACNWKQNDGMSGVGEDKTDDYFTGYIDELRLWNLCMNQTLIDQRNNTRVDDSETGLLFYVPFENYTTTSGVSDMIFSVNDRIAPAMVMTNTGVLESEDAANIKEVVTEAVIDLEAVVNNDAMILNPTSAAAWNDFEQRIVTFTVTGIQDVNGNETGSPIVWTAFIDRNHLKWSEEDVHVECSEYEGTDFSVDIVNIGGMNQGYTLQGMPSWLDVSSTSGNIAPKSSATIDFHVSEALNVGTYDQVIYMINDNGVARALNLTVKVNGETPDWSVNPADYRYNMSIYGKLRVDGVFSTDDEDRIAAFYNGKCVGVANNTYVKAYDMWYALLTVYGNEPKSGELEFRIWDASTGTTYIGEPSKTIAFESDAIEGTPVNPIVFETKEMRMQNITLNSGWNWISFNVDNGANSFDRMFAGGNWADNDQVKSETDQRFASYVADSAMWSGTLSGTQLSYKQMYLVKTENEQILSLSGTPLTETEQRTITVAPQWNYVAFLPTSNMTVKEALAGYDAAEGDIVKDQSGFAMYSQSIGWLGSLEYMKPGAGYMMFRSAGEPTAFVYPMLTANSTKEARVAEAPTGESAHDYPTTMSVVAVAGNMTLEAGDRILAFADDELRGASHAVANPADKGMLHFLSVAGDRAATLTFALERDGEIIATSKQKAGFASDAQLGTIRTPYVIDFSEGHAGLVYPTLFNDRLNVSYTMKGDARVDVRMFDLTGRVVRSILDVEPGEDGLHLTIDGLSDLASGMYLVDICVDGESNIHKVEKK